MARNKRTDADIARVRRVMEIRRSSAAAPVRNKKKYRRADSRKAQMRGEA